MLDEPLVQCWNALSSSLPFWRSIELMYHYYLQKKPIPFQNANWFLSSSIFHKDYMMHINIRISYVILIVILSITYTKKKSNNQQKGLALMSWSGWRPTSITKSTCKRLTESVWNRYYQLFGVQKVFILFWLFYIVWLEKLWVKNNLHFCFHG